MPIHAAILEKLRQNDPQLTQLDLNHQKLKAKDIHLLLQALASNSSLIQLSLDGNQIGDEGAKALAENKTLTRLDLGWNQIGDEGAKALAENRTLTYLDLIGNNIGTDGAKAFLKNFTLTSLIIFHNKISELLKSELYVHIEANQTREGIKRAHASALTKGFPKSLSSFEKPTLDEAWELPLTSLSLPMSDVEAAAGINLLEHKRWTPLHLACQEGHLETVVRLLRADIKVDLPTTDGATPLYIASANGHLDVVDYLLKAGAEVNFQEKDGWAPLHIASQEGHAKVVARLLDAKAQVDLPENHGWTALHIASQEGHAEVVACLLRAKNARVNLPATDGATPLYIASEQGHVEVVTHLLDAKAKVDLPEVDGWASLHIASANGHLDVVRLLLKAEAKVDLRGPNDCTPLYIASQNGHLSVVHCLIAAKAMINARCIHKETSVFVASETNQLAILGYLIGQGADIHLADSQGRTPLMIATINGHERAVSALLEAGARYNTRDQADKTAADYAKEKAHQAISDIFEVTRQRCQAKLREEGARFFCEGRLSEGLRAYEEGIRLALPLEQAEAEGQLKEVIQSHLARADRALISRWASLLKERAYLPFTQGCIALGLAECVSLSLLSTQQRLTLCFCLEEEQLTEEIQVALAGKLSERVDLSESEFGYLMALVAEGDVSLAAKQALVAGLLKPDASTAQLSVAGNRLTKSKEPEVRKTLLEKLIRHSNVKKDTLKDIAEWLEAETLLEPEVKAAFLKELDQDPDVQSVYSEAFESASISSALSMNLRPFLVSQRERVRGGALIEPVQEFDERSFCSEPFHSPRSQASAATFWVEVAQEMEEETASVEKDLTARLRG